ncbi:hypothetical protein MAUB1S_11403 [Mycolicibacterium aubagnense]
MADPLTLIRVVDTETTDVDDPAEMVELGWTDVRLFPEGWIIERGPISTLVDPGMPIKFPAMATHHITDAEATGGIHPDIARRIAAQGADILCAHNAGFDSRFIHGNKLPWICTFKAAKTAWPELQGHSNGAIRYERGLCLDDDRAYPPHRAGPDTWVTAHILLDLLKIYQVETLIEMSVKPVLQLKCYLKAHRGKRWSEVPTDYIDWILHKSDPEWRNDKGNEDALHTARVEWVKRTSDPVPKPAAPRLEPEPDPDSWRTEIARERF